jgi:predicted Fe-Mo cluster-binding NifX family protein
MEGKNGYIAMYKNKQIEVYANTSYEAQLKAAAIFKAKKSYQVDVYLCEKDGEQVTQSTNF